MRTAVFAGTFDPVTSGHLDIIKRARRLFDEVHVLVAYNTGKKCMFTDEKRLEMLEASVKAAGIDGIKCVLYKDAIHEYMKENGCCCVIKGARNGSDFDYERTLFLQSEALWDEFETIVIPSCPKYEHISSTYVRNLISFGYEIGDTVPDGAKELIQSENR